MKLKKVFHQDKLVRNKEGKVVDVAPGAIADVRVLSAKKVQHFSPSVIERGAAEGWLSMANGLISIGKGKDAVQYRIVRTPGYYCCHDNKPVDDGPSALEYIAANFKDVKSPDASNPAGYRRDNFYYCEKVETSVKPALAAIALAIAAAFSGHTPTAEFVGPMFVGANLVFNIALGRVAELYNRVDSNDPANSALIVIVIDANGDTDATMRDRDDISTLLGGTANEVTNTNYARKTLTDSDIVAFSPDDTNDRVDLDIPDQTWTAVAAGTAWTDIIIAYDNDTTGGNDTNLVPLSLHDFAVTPDGSDITAQIAAAGFYRASPV